MKKENSYPIWIKTGYQLFAEEGHEGIQIERLSRITGLNKSGFYHYFGDTHEFLKHLIQENDRIIDEVVEAIAKLDSYDPGFFNLMLQHKYVSFFHIQLVRNRHVRIFREAHQRNNKRIDSLTLPFFSKEVGLPEDVAAPYYEIMRDTFYTRVDFKTMNFEFLHSMMEKFKNMVSIIKEDQPQN
jgi:AcrR family transcriptional regulator